MKAIIRAKNEIRIKPEKQLDKVRKCLPLTEPISHFSFHLHLTNAFTVSILIFNYFLSYLFDHHFRTFTFPDFWACEKHCSLWMIAWHWAKTASPQLAIPESIRLHRNPETRPDLLAKDLHRNTLVPVTLQLTSRPRNSEIPELISFHTYLPRPT